MIVPIVLSEITVETEVVFYYPIHDFRLSVTLGWLAVDIFNLICRILVDSFQKLDVNRESRSLTTDSGNPCGLNICARKRWATWIAVIIEVHGIKCGRLENLSTMVNIVSWPFFDLVKLWTKFIDRLPQWRLGSSSTAGFVIPRISSTSFEILDYCPENLIVP